MYVCGSLRVYVFFLCEAAAFLSVAALLGHFRRVKESFGSGPEACFEG